MKKLLSPLLALFLMVLLLAAMPLTANAATEGYYTYTVTDGEATITDVDTAISGAITIPSTLGGYPVTSIDQSAFSNCTDLTSVTISDSVTCIGWEAFRSCTSLTSVTIPDSVTSIATYAFYDCTSLTSITIPDSVTNIGSLAFAYCSNLTSVTIGDSVTSIGEGAFEDCTSLQYSLYDNAKYLGNDTNPYYALIGPASTSITSCRIHPDTVVFSDYAFFSCTNLTSVTIPDSVTSIGKDTFACCTSLTSVTIGAGVTSIEQQAFYFCTSLTSVTIPDSVTSIGSSAFYNCESLTSVTIPDSVTSIGSSAFDSCGKLTSVTIPDSVTSIGSSAFAFCEKLTSVTIPDSVTSIGSSAFYNCKRLTSVTIPDSVTSIGESAFYYCYSLTSVTIPDSVTSIGKYAFFSCTSLTSVTIGAGVTSIEQQAFYFCTSLTSVTIPDSVTSIGSSAFYGCTSLTSVTYCGTEEQWNAISIDSTNGELTDAIRNYHNWQITTCTEPKMCTICGLPDGKILGHNLGIYKSVDFAHTNASNYPFTNTNGAWYSTNKIHSTSATYTLTATSSGTVTIEYGVSSESNYDKFTVKLNGTAIATISGSTTESKTVELSVGDIITFTYSKDFSASKGSDSGWFKVAKVFDTSVTTQNCTDDVYCDRCNMLIYAAGHNYLDATCTTPKTCTICGDTEGEAPGHSYATAIYTKPTFTVSGQQQKVCSVCGDTVTETVEMLVGEVFGWNVTLCDDLQVNFHLNISESIENTARVRIVVGEEGHTFRVSGLEKTEDGLYIASVNIAAAQMTDFIFVTVINGSDLAETASYTVRGYADTILADEGYSQYHQLVREMLNYGAAAQVYFDYENDNLANDGITDTEAVEIPDSVDNELSVSGNAEGVTFYGASLIFRNKIAVRYYFRFKGDINDCRFTVNDTIYAPQLKDGLYYVELADILPQDLDEEITLTVTDAKGNSLEVCYNPMNYIVRMNEKGSAELQALVKALYNYHLAAKALS